VTYLQGRKIAHGTLATLLVLGSSNLGVVGDLAARNVLVDSRRGCVLADFDLARWPGSVEQKCADQVPVRWAANELFHKKTPPTMASDIYSLGQCELVNCN
jgi:serine/threonine protein kinase